MSTIIKLLGTICLMLLLVAACDDDSPLTGGGRDSSGITDFPAAVGMLWTYEVYDSLTGTTDTVQVSIVDTHSLAGIVEVTVWRYNYGDSVTTRLVLLDDDTLKIWYDTCNAPPFEIFVFPLELGNVWTGPLIWAGDTSRVIDYGTISTPSGIFTNATRIDRSWMVDFEGGGNYITTWIVPGVGSAYRYRLRRWSTGGIVFTIVNEVWELVSYNLHTFDIHQFPNEVGWQWTYEINRWSFSDEYDTLTVTIVDTTTIHGNLHATIWEYAATNWIDTEYVVVTGDMVIPYPDTDAAYFYPLDYEFPLAVGRSWGMNTSDPLQDLEEKGPVSVPAGTFNVGFRYRHSRQGLNYFWFVDNWLVPGVGLVSRIEREYNLGPSKTVTWELLSYQPAR
ncbi:MAG: hypothetical protein ABII79_06115 [bacterium]